MLEDIKQAGQHSRFTLTWLRDHQLAANPLNYAICFAYFEDKIPGIKLAIDEAEANGSLTESLFLDLFQRYLLKDFAPDLKIQQSVTHIINGASSSISRTQNDLVNYKDSLNRTTESLADEALAGSLQQVIAGLINETSMMAEKSSQLEYELAEASKELTELRARYEDAEQSARTDPLTKLLNRNGLEYELQRIFDNEEDNLPLSCVMVDIDHFKKFNDTFGHAVGDQVLKLVAHTLDQNTKGADFACRLGGEEFVLVLPHTPLNNAFLFAESIRKKVEAMHFKKKMGNRPIDSVTISLGVTEFVENESINELFDRADKALYQAKNNGRNLVAKIA